MKENYITRALGLAIILGAIVLTAMFLVWNAQRVEGSVFVTSEYQATTTDSGWSTTQCKDTLTNYKTLGSVVVTFTSNADLYIYDATTTNISLRTGNHATTSLALFPSTAAGTYTFDVQAKRGICIVAESSAGVASTTITFR